MRGRGCQRAPSKGDWLLPRLPWRPARTCTPRWIIAFANTASTPGRRETNGEEDRLERQEERRGEEGKGDEKRSSFLALHFSPLLDRNDLSSTEFTPKEKKVLLNGEVRLMALLIWPTFVRQWVVEILSAWANAMMLKMNLELSSTLPSTRRWAEVLDKE